MYIDTHCHIYKEYYDDIDETIAEAKEKKVNKLIVIGSDKESINEVTTTMRDKDNIFYALGFHPSEVNEVTDKDIEWLEKIVKKGKKVIAIGEIGLDYYWVKDNKKEQKELFIKMLRLAKRVNLPVIIHSRDAFQDTYDILKEEKVMGIIHCFTSNIENAKKYIEIGFLLGIGGVLTFKNTKLKEVIKELDLKNIVLETDSPYLTPEPFRGKDNHPKYIPLIAEEIGKLKEMSIEEVAEITSRNAEEMLNI